MDDLVTFVKQLAALGAAHIDYTSGETRLKVSLLPADIVMPLPPVEDESDEERDLYWSGA